ncbi:MAG TPA: hypothetical protein VJ577_03540 [Burkholderiaceae bacterium]|nr:hypothetical protein [Burkholderiaceae bacterium]
MTLRARSEAARRMQAARRASYPREVFAYPYWVGGWAHPFESRWAAYQKYAWINNATKPEYSILTWDNFWNYEKKANLEERLFALVPSEQRAPRIRLWDKLALPHAVCQVCLESGYWSELPQLAGYDQCPLHGVPLQRRCRKCLRPLQFGHPRFGQTGPFVCGACGEPLTPFPTNACLQWHRMPSEDLLSRLAPLHALAQRFATECEGYWEFPWTRQCPERQWILHAFTGHRLRQEWETNGTLLCDSAIKQVIPVTFILPCDETVLAAELANYRRALLADVAHHFRQYPAAALSTRGVTEMRMIYMTHELHISAGGTLPENLQAVLQWMDEVKQRKDDRTMEDVLDSELSTYYSVSPLVRFVPKILLAFSVWQIVRVLLWLDSLIETMTVQLTNANGMTDQISALLQEQPYAIRLLRGRIDDANFVFELECGSWIPPYRLRKMTDGIELTIFQIVPQFDGR